MDDTPDTEKQVRLISALHDPECYPHPVQRVEFLETHISWVILAGRYAYKIKKAVNLGFLDFTTLEKRGVCCHEELRLNRRFAPSLYLDVVSITGSTEQPHIGGEGRALEYAVKMYRFAQEQLASQLLKNSKLTRQHTEHLAGKIATFHDQASAARPGERWGSPRLLRAYAIQNFDQIATLPGAIEDRQTLGELRDWTKHEFAGREATFGARQAQARVRECHGDLHLGNIALIDGEITPFDCIEFSAELRWIDVASEVAFLVMDLIDRGRPDFAFLFLSDYLEFTGDYGAMTVLRFYLVYRAMVRAKVHCLRAHQPGIGNAERKRLLGAYRSYLDLAQRFTPLPKPFLIIMHGLSGSGKSMASHALLQALGAVRIRSDVERKRLHHMAVLERSASGVTSGIYTEETTRRVYRHLAQIARDILKAGYTVILDAAFLRRWQRNLMRDLACELGASFAIASLQAPETVLKERILRRGGEGHDASDADLAVLSHQLATEDPLADDELACAALLDATQSARSLATTPGWQALLDRARTRS
ncbi:MAG: AAA family ATPase [Burkholderiales bacterium]|nr:AAA family ATPase [Burkholderiales bacterium]